jgi:hypothetical protein
MPTSGVLRLHGTNPLSNSPERIEIMYVFWRHVKMTTPRAGIRAGR